MAPLALENLHPTLWRAHQVARPGDSTWPSHFPELDAVLPGAGWPAQALTERLLPHPGVGELRLLAPVLAAVQQAGRCLMWFDPPAAPCAWALGALGIDTRQLVLVRSRDALRRAARPVGGSPRAVASERTWDGTPMPLNRARERLPAPDVLWALEQALKSGHVGAVLAWLPARLPADTLRRLQLAAQAHEGPAFVLREVAARFQPSAAPLRLLLAASGPDELRLTLLKRRGPPLAQPLLLALPPVLSPMAQARAWAAQDTAAGAAAAAVGLSPPLPLPPPLPPPPIPAVGHPGAQAKA